MVVRVNKEDRFFPISEGFFLVEISLMQHILAYTNLNILQNNVTLVN